MIRKILKILNNIHKRNVLHKDLKSQNILIDAKGNLKICDFG